MEILNAAHNQQMEQLKDFFMAHLSQSVLQIRTVMVLIFCTNAEKRNVMQIEISFGYIWINCFQSGWDSFCFTTLAFDRKHFQITAKFTFSDCDGSINL